MPALAANPSAAAALGLAEAQHPHHVYRCVDTIDSGHGPPVFPVYYV